MRNQTHTQELNAKSNAHKGNEREVKPRLPRTKTWLDGFTGLAPWGARMADGRTPAPQRGALAPRIHREHGPARAPPYYGRARVRP